MNESSLAIFMIGLLCGIVLTTVVYTGCIYLGDKARKRDAQRAKVVQHN